MLKKYLTNFLTQKWQTLVYETKLWTINTNKKGIKGSFEDHALGTQIICKFLCC